MSKKIQIIYDQECPFCSKYCQLIKIKKAAGEIELIDARAPSSVMEKITAKNFDIDNGMVVTIEDEIYYGDEAIHVLSLLSARSDLFNCLNYHLFKSKRMSKILYPLLRDCRNVALWLLGKSRIHNLKTGRSSWIGK